MLTVTTELHEMIARLHEAKRFINSEITQYKLSGQFDPAVLSELGTQLDRIHEAERVGLRKLSDIEFVRIRRVLTSVEARMSLPKN